MPMCHSCHLGHDRHKFGSFANSPSAVVGAPCKHRDGCQKSAYATGLCRMHYDRVRRYGGVGPVGMIGKRAPLEERFFNHVRVGGPMPRFNPRLGACSIWTGYVHPSGFGAIWRGHSLIYVHRLAWEMAHGTIPPGALIEHVCLTQLCIRIDHLCLCPTINPPIT